MKLNKRYFLTLFLLFLLTLNQSVEGSAASVQEPVAETFSDLKIVSDKAPEFIKPSDVKSVAEFCQINGYRDRAESFYWINADQAFPDFGWENSFYATFQTREHSFLLRFSDQDEDSLDLKSNSEDFVISSWNKLFKRLRLNTGPIQGLDQLATYSGKLDSDSVSADQEQDLHVGLAQASYVCTDLTYTSINSCSNGVGLIQKISKPVSSITMLPLWNEMAKDPIYIDVFRKMANQIALNIYNRTAPKSRFFDDLMALFVAATDDHAKAADYTWKTMALLSSGGGNTFYRPQMMTFKPMTALADLIWILSMGPMTLDRLTYPLGYLYSYPKEINNVCDYGKNYHFWMSAYLAREAFKANHDIVGSAAAAFSAEKGYQFAKKDGTRDPSKPFRQNIFSNYNNNIRLDLTLAAAGAWYGAQSLSRNNSLSQEQVNRGFFLSFDGSQDPGRKVGFLQSDFDLTRIKDALVLYSDWKKITNSDAAFKYFEKEINP